MPDEATQQAPAAEQPEQQASHAVVDDPSKATGQLQELHGELWGPLGPLHPTQQCERITADGGVLKLVLQPGSGDPPKKFARCLVHYLGRLQSNGAIFMDTKAESHTQQPVRVVAGRHASQTETGLYLGVESMRVGERAVIYVEDPQYGYGAKGSFSFPSVPPSEQLTYEIEFVDYEASSDAEQGDGTGLLYEERLERAETRRLAGNQLFSEGKYKEALGKYAAALSYLDEDFMYQLEGFYEDKANEVKLPIHLNMAACQLKTGDYHTTIYNCTEVLKHQPDHVKALYRRAIARHKLGQTEEALKDLLQALEKAPDDRAIAKELAAVRLSLKQERVAEAKLFKGQFKSEQNQGLQRPDDITLSDAANDHTKPDGSMRQRKQGGTSGSSTAQEGGGDRAGGGQGEGQKRRGWLGWLLGLVLVLFTFKLYLPRPF